MLALPTARNPDMDCGYIALWLRTGAETLCTQCGRRYDNANDVDKRCVDFDQRFGLYPLSSDLAVVADV